MVKKMNFEFQIEYIKDLVDNPINYFKNPILGNISCFRHDNICLYFSLYAISSLKNRVEYYSTEYLSLIHEECVARQKIQEGSYSLFETINQLYIAYKCAKEIQEIYLKLNIRYPIDNLVGMQEEATILTKLSKIEGSLDTLNNALKLFEFVKNKTKDKQLRHLAMMNEAKLRLEFAIEKINPIENCIKSIKLSENARKYYKKGHKWYEAILYNQLNATLELEINESYGFKIENFTRIKKLIEKTEPDNSINRLKLRLSSIDLYMTHPSELDNIYSDIKKLKETTQYANYDYHRGTILEGEILIKKAQNSKSSIESEVKLSKAIKLFIDYQRKYHIEDKYYLIQSKYKEAIARLLLYKINGNENELNTILRLLTDAKAFYEEIPLQNQIKHCPLILYYLSLTKKEIFSKNETLNENYKEIEDLLLKAITNFKKRKNYKKVVECYLELGKLFFNLKMFEEAYNYLNDGIELIESIRDSIIDLQLKETFFNNVTEFYTLMIDTCCNLNKTKETLKYVELTKQRSFLDKIIINHRKNLIGSSKFNLANKLNSIEKDILRINEELDNFDKNGFIYSELYEKFLMTKQEQLNIISKIKKEDPKYYNDYFNNTHNFSNIDLEDRTVIEYYYTEEYLLIFLIDKHQTLMKKVDEFNNENDLFRRLNDIIIDTKYDVENLEEFNDILREFYVILIEPIKDRILNEKLLIIPYGKLHNIPFNGLYGHDYLINDYEITIVQSLSIVKYLKNNYNGKTDDCLIIGNPNGDLPNSEKEVDKIAELLKIKPLIYKDANKENVLDSLKNKKIIHFAGHGNFDMDNPMNSSLKLYDGNLSLKDLENTNIDSELIVLSSCETGLTFINKLDENIGLVNYLQINGAKFVIAHLWSINDESGMKLFNNFYPVEKDYSKTLRDSQLNLKKEYDIYKWGGFQIYGFI